MHHYHENGFAHQNLEYRLNERFDRLIVLVAQQATVVAAKVE